MPEYLDQPVTFDAADRFLHQQVDLPTTLTSNEIAQQLPDNIRKHSFFSATVSSDTILRELRKEVELIAQGKRGLVDARKRLKDFLATQGYGTPVPGSVEDRDVTALSSTRRLNLILRQNVAMAHAVGQREVAEHPAVVAYLPNYKYDAKNDAFTRSHHADLDGLVLPKKHPFWRTHYPPWEFNCRCFAYDTDEPVNGASGSFQVDERGGDVNGRTVALPSASFVFDSRPEAAFKEPDLSLIKNDTLRSQVQAVFEHGPVVSVGERPPEGGGRTSEGSGPAGLALQDFAVVKSGKALFRQAVRLVGSLHGVPPLPEVTMFTGKMKPGELGEYHEQTKSIEVARDNPFKLVTALHEIGHWIDLHAFERNVKRPASQYAPALDEWRQTVMKTNTWSRLQNRMGKINDKYWGSWPEVWSRWYSQYAAAASGNRRAVRELTAARAAFPDDLYFDDGDVEALQKVTDRLLFKQGLRK